MDDMFCPFLDAYRWDSEGPFKPLHLMNPTRLAFIRSALFSLVRKDPYSAKPLEGLKIVDVGCGGGILSQPLARLGANVTGVDAVEKIYKIAQLHAVCIFWFGISNFNYVNLLTKRQYDMPNLEILYISLTSMKACFKSFTSWIADLCWILMQRNKLKYCMGFWLAEKKLVEEGRKFDAVMALEVIEHVANPAEFCKSLAALTVPDGATVISTINRSMRAYATAIVAAEYILRWLPRGTHQWSSFLTPEELVLILQRAGINVEEMAGFVYNPVTGRWSLSDDISVNFIAFGTKSNNTE
ncbi:LOW QUALITY PROTEIN: ubiquinone biosynthesis O-methyltransferase, mitochondrial [Vigna umbellata]|uniref:LOW QUALITY PROTEIN: ubiquinone biosynthesis O-methyltransferase, mitochondrial n=1 Tax=Vigna umbellata TaxID=87088 RepID=UPI001F5EDD36|nr:LOW QUALITY PROTEIN: ubiquinone biosynthesis O-methyltransferase, mitochondrial [Vigna umbellata]